MVELVSQVDLRKSIRPEDVITVCAGRDCRRGGRGRCGGPQSFLSRYRLRRFDRCGPRIDSILMVVYRRGQTRMRRKVETNWREGFVKPGTISMLGVDRSSDWEWDGNIEVSHFYLSKDLMSKMALRAFESEYRHFHAIDDLCIEDPSLLALTDALEAELRNGASGSRLLTDLLSQALTLQVLRNHHICDRASRDSVDAGTTLTGAQRQRVIDFVEANLAKNFSLADLANTAGLCEHTFPRRFKAAFEQSPWQFVLVRRVHRAMALINDTRLSLAEIAFLTGFSDQAHMTRVMKKATGQTPGNLRRA